MKVTTSYYVAHLEGRDGDRMSVSVAEDGVLLSLDGSLNSVELDLAEFGEILTLVKAVCESTYRDPLPDKLRSSKKPPVRFESGLYSFSVSYTNWGGPGGWDEGLTFKLDGGVTIAEASFEKSILVVLL